MFDESVPYKSKMVVNRNEHGQVTSVLCGSCGCLNVIDIKLTEELIQSHSPTQTHSPQASARTSEEDGEKKPI